MFPESVLCREGRQAARSAREALQSFCPRHHSGLSFRKPSPAAPGALSVPDSGPSGVPEPIAPASELHPAHQAELTERPRRSRHIPPPAGVAPAGPRSSKDLG